MTWSIRRQSSANQHQSWLQGRLTGYKPTVVPEYRDVCERHFKGSVSPVENPPPNSSDPKHKIWAVENIMATSWLINSMTDEIGENFLLCQTAQEIGRQPRIPTQQWKTRKHIWYWGIPSRQQQGDMMVTHYTHTWSCTTDTAYIMKINREKKIYKFLLGWILILKKWGGELWAFDHSL